MRKIVTFSLVAASALALAACGGNTEAPADANATTEVTEGEATANATTDEMTNVDAAAGAEANATAANTVEEAAANTVEAANAQ